MGIWRPFHSNDRFQVVSPLLWIKIDLNGHLRRIKETRPVNRFWGKVMSPYSRWLCKNFLLTGSEKVSSESETEREDTSVVQSITRYRTVYTPTYLGDPSGRSKGEDLSGSVHLVGHPWIARRRCLGRWSGLNRGEGPL